MLDYDGFLKVVKVLWRCLKDSVNLCQSVFMCNWPSCLLLPVCVQVVGCVCVCVCLHSQSLNVWVAKHFLMPVAVTSCMHCKEFDVTEKSGPIACTL